MTEPGHDAREPSALVMTRCFAAPRELVWEAWTDPRHVSAWWGPFGEQDTRCELDATIGSVFLVAMRAPDGTEHVSRGIIREIVPPERLVIEGDRDAPDACGAGLPPGALVTIRLAEEAGGTRLTLEARFPTTAARAAAEAGGYVAGWRGSLDVLDRRLERLAAAVGGSP